MTRPALRQLAWLAIGLVCLGCSGKPADKPATKPAANGESTDKATDTTPEPAPLPPAPAPEPAPLPPEPAPPPPAPNPEPAPPANPVPPAPNSEPATSSVRLDDPALTAGIPGEGPLTVEQITAWLDTPGVLEPFTPELPMGLSGGKLYGLEENPLSRAKIELGRQLFFDGRLSADGTVSCASCHHPDHAYGRETRFGVGINGQQGGRNSPIAYNRILSGAQFWDGRAASLEEQAKGPIINPIEMGNTHEQAVQTLQAIPGYVLQFQRIFPEQGLTIDTVAQAIASFERALVTGPTPYDYYEPLRRFQEQYREDLEDLAAFEQDEPQLFARYQQIKAAADAHPLSESARRGRELFFGKAKCTACHAGANFTDELYHNLGVGMAADEPDLGRFTQTMQEKDKGAFKTPTIRNVSLTAPYMHDGSQQTLLEVVQWYDQGGHPNPYLSERIQKLMLSAEEKADLVAFMEELTGALPVVQQERLPVAE